MYCNTLSKARQTHANLKLPRCPLHSPSSPLSISPCNRDLPSCWSAPSCGDAAKQQKHQGNRQVQVYKVTRLSAGHRVHLDPTLPRFWPCMCCSPQTGPITSSTRVPAHAGLMRVSDRQSYAKFNTLPFPPCTLYLPHGMYCIHKSSTANRTSHSTHPSLPQPAINSYSTASVCRDLSSWIEIFWCDGCRYSSLRAMSSRLRPSTRVG